MNHHKTTAAAAGFAMLCATALATTPAHARSHGGGTAVRASGACTNGAGTWTLKAKTDDAGLEIEFQVDTNRVGQVWHVRITDNGQLVLSRDVTTTAPSGSFTVNPHTADRVGVTDTIRAHAFRGDQVCGGLVRV
jgi:hypothetical protein